ncbi:MAG: DUF5689 domain-containing protein [Saprospiraceae bacterium]
MTSLTKYFLPLLIAALGTIAFSSCIDENFDQPPTGGSPLPEGIANTSIKDLKARHTLGSLETITEDLVISGVVVADDATGNWYRTFVLQDETGGIEVTVDLADSYVFYPEGREIAIKCNGLVLGDYNDLIQLGGYIANDNTLGPIADVTEKIVKGALTDIPAPKNLTFAGLSLNDVSTLVTFENVQFITSDTSTTLADALHQEAYNLHIENCAFEAIVLRTSGFADFANENVPNGGGSITGILGVYRGDYQLLIRRMDDLALNGSRCTFDPCAGISVVVVDAIDEDFAGGANNDNVIENGWTNFAVKGSRLWIYKLFDGNVYAQSTAFNDSSPEMESWLVTPGINLDIPKVLTFDSAKAFWTHDGLSVWISTDFICDPSVATWQPLDCTIAAQNDDDHAWIPSGDIDLSGYTGNTVFIGFKYVGSSSSGLTSSYRIDNVVVE